MVFWRSWTITILSTLLFPVDPRMPEVTSDSSAEDLAWDSHLNNLDWGKGTSGEEGNESGGEILRVRSDCLRKVHKDGWPKSEVKHGLVLQRRGDRQPGKQSPDLETFWDMLYLVPKKISFGIEVSLSFHCPIPVVWAAVWCSTDKGWKRSVAASQLCLLWPQREAGFYLADCTQGCWSLLVRSEGEPPRVGSARKSKPGGGMCNGLRGHRW